MIWVQKTLVKNLAQNLIKILRKNLDKLQDAGRLNPAFP